MIKHVKFFGYYFFGWLSFFFIARGIFYFSNFQILGSLEKKTVFWSFMLGLRLDLSLVSYLIASILLLRIITLIFNGHSLFITLTKTITFLYVAIVNLLVIIDTLIFPHWGIRLDSTILIYLNTPIEMMASLKTSQLLIATIIYFLSIYLSYFFFLNIINRFIYKNSKFEFIFFLILLFCTVIGIRGGLQEIPINQSNIYFSTNQNANHLANNGIWNFGYSFFKGIHNKENPYVLLEKKEAEKIIYSRIENINSKYILERKILNNSNPNIILIIWESLTAKIVKPLNGYTDVTPNFNRLCNEGLLFTNFYANGDRSDKGLVSLLSSYYPQCQKSIIKTPSKSKSLPIITKTFSDDGYNCSFYYGGDLNFGNMNSYLLNAGLNEIISGSDFDKNQWNSKWGIHDHIVLERVLKDLQNDKSKPFFKTIFTLTSHEPYEFPGESQFKENTEIDRFKSAHHYTDHSINQFIDVAKKQDWWNNTLIIITADHGHRLPMHKGDHNSPVKFHIPMLWLGGALDSIGIADNFGSQTDLNYTLLTELGKKNELISFPFSKNLFSRKKMDFAHYIFNNGFGIIDYNGNCVYDYNSNNILEESGLNKYSRRKLGLSFTQVLFEDYLKR